MRTVFSDVGACVPMVRYTVPWFRETLLIDARSGKPLDDASERGLVAEPQVPLVNQPSVNSPPSPQKELAKREDLGVRAIEGFRCRGTRDSFKDRTTETWEPDEVSLGRPVLTRSVTPTDEYEGRLFNIRLGEPDPAVFAPLEPGKK